MPAKKNGKAPYICGPLTELPSAEQAKLKAAYSEMGDVCGEVLGVRAFVPHEHYDPVAHPNATPQEVDLAERAQVCKHTSMLIVVAHFPSWGGGIEVEMAHRSHVVALLFRRRGQPCSRLLRGNPAIQEIVEYDHISELPERLRAALLRKRGLQQVT